MPELPEVETIRLGLLERILGIQIGEVDVRKPKIARGDALGLSRALRGNSFSRIERRGKLLLFFLESGDEVMLVHLKMTGQLIYEKDESLIAGGHSFRGALDALPNSYSHIIISFIDGGVLYFNDMRQFGYMYMMQAKRLPEVLAGYGIEPLGDAYTWDNFLKAVGTRSALVKAVLLNQFVVAGLGNIYVDEVCFQAKVRPGRRMNSLTLREKRALFTAIPNILRKAIEYGGTTFSAYRDVDGGRGNYSALLRVYGRAGEPCVRCGSLLVRQVLAGRGTVFCEKCQT